ncbi:SH3 domain-containing protein, partial [Myxococcota bacterium]|nr:SH3 domain-containing protein [Myxococcota bacterium]
SVERAIGPEGDEPAPPGHAYVQVERARLRATAAEDSPLAGTLELGELVKVYDRVGEWALVLVLPDGPSGFLSARLVAERKPIAALAKERAFADCATRRDRSRDDCLYDSKQQYDSCLVTCGPVTTGTKPPAPVVRCADACQVAWSECQRSCAR